MASLASPSPSGSSVLGINAVPNVKMLSKLQHVPELAFTGMFAAVLHRHVNSEFSHVEVHHQVPVLGSIPDILFTRVEPATTTNSERAKLPLAFIEVSSETVAAKAPQMFCYAVNNLIASIDSEHPRNPCQLGLNIQLMADNIRWTLLGYCLVLPEKSSNVQHTMLAPDNPAETKLLVADVVLGSGGMSNLSWALQMLVLCCLHCGWDYSPMALDWPSNVCIDGRTVLKMYRAGTKRQPNVELFQAISDMEARLTTLGPPHMVCKILQYPFQQGSHTASSVQQVLTIARQLDKLHTELKIVHGDIRGGNLIFGDKSVIIDFDFASPETGMSQCPTYPDGYTTDGLGDAERHPAAKSGARMAFIHDIYSLHSVLKGYTCDGSEQHERIWRDALGALVERLDLKYFIDLCEPIASQPLRLSCARVSSDSPAKKVSRSLNSSHMSTSQTPNFHGADSASDGGV